uniref:M superfamily MMSK group conopeptide Ec3-TP04 n=2 Tax=Conus TaxID=6490 RepID=H2BKM3_CONEM|nr:M superfamily MMSK group conopeptide Ec3-TP04 [Conus emaciatus]AEX60370.1 M superfamily MMSK group conopeptide Cp+Rt+Vt3-TP06 [Conus capitaneus]
MMSKLGVLLTVCLLLCPLTALPLDEDQLADRPAERMQDDTSAAQIFGFDPVKRCCQLLCYSGCTPCCHI